MRVSVDSSRSAVSHARASTTWRRRPDTIAAIAMVPMIVSAAALAAGGGHFREPAVAAVYWGYQVAVSMLAGLVWRRRRPSARFGLLLYALGLTMWGMALQGAQNPVVYAVGFVSDGLMVLVNFHLCLAFSSGRLQSRIERLLIAAIAISVVGGQLAFMLVTGVLEGGSPLAECVRPCPENPFQIADSPAVVELVRAIRTPIALVAVAGIAGVYVVRLRRASRPQRRALIVVACSSLILLPAFFAFQLVARFDLGSSQLRETLGWILFAARVIFPLGFLLALLQAAFFAQRAQNRMLLALSTRPTIEQWRGVVADALDDPSVRPLDGSGSGDRAGPARLRVPVERDGRTIATLEADTGLGEDPELLEAAALATLVAIETGQLEGALHETRARAAAAGAAERRRFGRDLHDGAQQRLLAIRLRLGELADADAVADLDDELGLALQELRDLAQGLSPPVLARHGVPAALRAVTRGSDRVVVDDRGLGRHAPACESAVYFCCLEAIQNAVKHAGRNASITVALAAAGDYALFEVRDDGTGFDPATHGDGSGLAGLEDRVAALGGELEIDATPGRGTHVRGRVPIF